MRKFIQIKTPLPGPKSQEIEARRGRFVAGAMGGSLCPCYVESAEGALFHDVDGNTFIDLTGGWGCLAVGHVHPKVTKAIQDQVVKFLHTDFTAVPYESYIDLCELLAKHSPGPTPKKAALFNSGAEAVENTIKIARAYTGRTGIVCFENAFHGRTLLTMTLTHKATPYKYKFGPYASDIYRMPYPTENEPTIRIEDFERTLCNLVNPESIAAFLVEPIQGEGGFRVPAPGFIPMLRKIADKYGILFIADEVQSGIGRTGKFYAIENFGIEPDLISSAKSIAAGMPLSAVIGKAEIMDKLPGGCIGGTYVGNPVACRAGIEVIHAIDEEHLLERALEIGKILKERFLQMKAKYSAIGSVHGIGSMMAMEFLKDHTTREPATKETAQIIQEGLKRGILMAGAGVNKNLLRMLISMDITDEQLHEAMDVLDESIGAVYNK